MSIPDPERDCLKIVRKPITPLKVLDKIFRRRNVKNSQYYFTNRKHALSKEYDKKPRRPFQVPKPEKLLSYIRYSDRKNKEIYMRRIWMPLHLKDNLRIAETRDLSKRLFLEEPVDDVRAVVEIHPEFYSVIEGRPLRLFDDIKVYTQNIRNYAMNRQQTGYRKDLILNMDMMMYSEETSYNKISENYRRHVHDFQRFLTEDYTKACEKQAQAEKLHELLLEKINEYLMYATKVTILNNILFKLDAIRNILKIYRQYLMFVAPIVWRQKHDETLRSRITSIQFDKGEFATDNDLVEALDVDKMVELARKELENPMLAELYFNDADEMIDLFRTMEVQSREYLIQLSKTGAPYRVLLDRIKELKAITQTESEYFQYYVDSLNRDIEREEYNEQNLQEVFFRILNGYFYDTIASPATLKLKICVEFVYEEIFGKCEEGHHNIRDPMKILEVFYENYNLLIDSLDFQIVNKARNECFADDIKIMKQAKLAQRILREFKEMSDAMNRAFEPPKQFRRIKEDRKKYHKHEHGKTVTISDDQKLKYKLTNDERESLLLFTDWCEGKDPSSYLREYYQYVKPTFDMEARPSF